MKKGLTIGFAVLMLLGLMVVGVADVTEFMGNFWGTGILYLDAQAVDTSTWHPGVVGNSNTFDAVGEFQGSFHAAVVGYGGLDTQVTATSAYGSNAGANFVYTDTQDFDVLSANWNRHVTGNFYAHASGSDGNVYMNLDTAPSMYVWSEAGGYGDVLRGTVIEKEVWTEIGGAVTADLYVGVFTGPGGVASMQNSASHGWSTAVGYDTYGHVTTNYAGGTRTVSATGYGYAAAGGFGNDGFTWDPKFTAIGGGSTGTDPFGNPALFFNAGLTGTYHMSGYGD